jgi:hypothetical protein
VQRSRLHVSTHLLELEMQRGVCTRRRSLKLPSDSLSRRFRRRSRGPERESTPVKARMKMDGLVPATHHRTTLEPSQRDIFSPPLSSKT